MEPLFTGCLVSGGRLGIEISGTPVYWVSSLGGRLGIEISGTPVYWTPMGVQYSEVSLFQNDKVRPLYHRSPYLSTVH